MVTRSLVKPLIKAPAGATPVYLLSALAGHALQWRPLARYLSPRWQLVGVLYPVFAGSQKSYDRIEDLAEDMIAPLLQVSGPIILIGHSVGGTIAYAMASQLAEAGREVSVVMLDTRLKRLSDRHPWPYLWGQRILRKSLRLLFRWPPRSIARGNPKDPQVQRFQQETMSAVRRYVPPASDVPIYLLRARHYVRHSWLTNPYVEAPDHGWSKVAPVVHITPVPGDHLSFMDDAYEEVLFAAVAETLDRVATRGVAKSGAISGKEGVVL